VGSAASTVASPRRPDGQGQDRAIDLDLRRPTRAHEDVEVAIFRADQLAG
jgi:hypothetical protein